MKGHVLPPPTDPCPGPPRTVTDIQALAGFAEPVSSWTHLGGALLFLFVGVRRLPDRRESPGPYACLLVFAIATVAQLLLSGVYHLVPLPSVFRPTLQVLDHAAIFVLIAATLTVVHGLLFTGAARHGMIAVAWTLCVAGVVLKTVYFDETAEWLGLASYFAMGLLGLLTTVALWRTRGPRATAALLAGGLVYTAGALADFLRTPELVPGIFGPHETLHVAVLVALGLHWAFVLRVLEEQRAKLAVAESVPGR